MPGRALHDVMPDAGCLRGLAGLGSCPSTPAHNAEIGSGSR